MPTNYQTTEHEIETFSGNLLKAGVDITQYDKNDKIYLFKVARLCARQAGIPLGAAAGVALAGAGSVTLPFIGAVPGYVAGFLAGALGGTVSCTISKMAIKKELDSVLGNTSAATKNTIIEGL